MLRLTPPTSLTFSIAVILAAVAVAGQLVPQISGFLPISLFWLGMIAFLVLMLGNLIRGL